MENAKLFILIASLFTSLSYLNFFDTTFQHGFEDDIELSGGTRIIHEFTHVADDQGRTSLDVHSTFSHASREHRDQETEGRHAHVVDEGGGDKSIQGVLGEFDGVHVGGHDTRDDGDDVHVGDGGADLSKGNATLVLDLRWMETNKRDGIRKKVRWSKIR